MNIQIANWVDIDAKNYSFLYRGRRYGLEIEEFSKLVSGQISNNDSVLFLAREGILWISTSNNEQVHFTELAARITEAVHSTTLNLFPNSYLEIIMSGNADRNAASNWLRSMFDFTKSSRRHIGSMVKESKHRDEDTATWKQFHREEKDHWKIYARVFKTLGIDILVDRERPCVQEVEKFVSELVRASTVSQYHYAALLNALETGPEADRLVDDEQFFSLVRYYGFSEEEIDPLFQHTLLNREIEHATLWFDILSQKEFFSRSEVESILCLCRSHIELSFQWMEGIPNMSFENT